MRGVFSIFSYVVAGFFCYLVMVVSFIAEPPITMKFILMAVFAIPAVISLLIGLNASGFTYWKRDAGMVFLASSLFTLFVVFSFACMFATPEISQQFPEKNREFFSDYLSGACCILGFCAAGGLLVWQHSTSKPKRDDVESV